VGAESQERINCDFHWDDGGGERWKKRCRDVGDVCRR
jgi:hypothetical protein